jgi:long-chain acyl-CoA synthetase
MRSYPYDNFYQALQDNAKKFPEKKVVFFEKQTLTNKALLKQIDAFARFLEISDITQGDTVGLILSNGIEFIVSFFAVSKIGAVAVPINNFLKAEEFEYILNDCSAKMLITSSEYGAQTKQLQNSTKIEKTVWCGNVEALDEHNFSYDEIITLHESNEVGGAKVGLEDTACIVYTSGTTGKPKGAMLTYKGIFSNALNGKEIFQINPKDRFLVFLPMFHSFTLSIMIVLPLVTGAAIIVVKSVFPFSNVLKNALLKRATVFLGVPTLYNALVKAKIPWYFMWFNKIRVFISGSAPLSEHVINEFNKKFKNAVLTEGYGLSETSPAVCVNRLDRQKPLSVGLPFDDYEIKVVDEESVEVPTGEVGEIIVKGDCIMKGYLNLPEATAQTIINGWLKTGDLGRFDEDGFLYIVDRKKDLIIAKGLNIYPREIEELLYKYEGVEAAAVIGVKEAQTNDEIVVAYIQPQEKITLEEGAIKQYLKQHLANFKLPKHIYFVNELPKNATGKVLKRVLKEQLNPKNS